MRKLFASSLLFTASVLVVAFSQSAFAQETVSATLVAKYGVSIPGDSIIHSNQSVGNLDLAAFDFSGAPEECGIYNDSPHAIVIHKGQAIKVSAVLGLGFIEFDILNIPVEPPSQIELYITQPPVGPLDYLTAKSALAQLTKCAAQSGLFDVVVSR